MRKFEEAAYREFAEALRERVAAYAPDWTDHDDGDPGITLIELFAFLTESLLYRANALPERTRSSAARLAQSASALAEAGAGTGSGTIERPRYFTGQLLGVDDFKLEQDYFRARLRRLNRQLLGSGIVHGLGVSVTPAGSAQHVVVEPGFAISPKGEEIEMPAAATAALPGGRQSVYVILLHVERPTHPQPAAGCQDPQFTRIEEGSAVRLEAAARADGVALARLIFASDGWQVDDAFEPARVAAFARRLP